MVAIIDSQRSELETLCRKHRVRRLEVFGSAADGLARTDDTVRAGGTVRG
jgi:predicted nucleotidyltransferase